MRVFILLLLILGTAGPTLARCGSTGFSALPSTEIIKQNSLILLTGYASSQEVVSALNKQYPVYLAAEGHQVKLSVVRIEKGAFSMTEAVLKPDKLLQPGVSYQLKIDGLTANQAARLVRYNAQGEKEPLSWQVEAGLDTEVPVLLKQPTLVASWYVPFGCGPSVGVAFTMETKDRSQVLVETEVLDLSTGTSTVALLGIGNQQRVRVGHGMCFGAFVFLENRKYKVRFRLMDVCGNKSKQWTDWSKFDSPSSSS